MKILIPQDMIEGWKNFAEVVINNDMKKIPCSLSNTIAFEDKVIYIELNIRGTKAD